MRWGVVGVAVLLVVTTGGIAPTGPATTQRTDAPTLRADEPEHPTGRLDRGADDLTVLWTSDPRTDLTLQSNHHTPDAVRFRGETYVAVPLNGRHGSFCALSVLDGDGDLRWRDTIPDERCTVHAVSDPAIADYDRDGRPEVLAATSEAELVAYNLTTGTEELRRNLTSYGYSRPIVANLTAAAGPETAVVDLLGGVFVLRSDGGTAWHRKLDDARVRQPAVEDFDADGRPELVVGQLSGPVTLLDGDGTTAWRTTVSNSVAIRWLATGRLDGDPAVEVVVATYTGHVVALDGANGSVEWTLDLGGTAVNLGAPELDLGATALDRRASTVAAASALPVAAADAAHGTTGASVHAVGDGDGDGRAEVYPTARNGRLYAVTGSNGTVEWSVELADGPVSVAPPPSLGDVDGDDRPELVAVTDDGTVAVVDPADGSVLATYSRDAPIRTFPRIADLDGDGAGEILVIYGDGRVVALSYGPADGTGDDGVNGLPVRPQVRGG